MLDDEAIKSPGTCLCEKHLIVGGIALNQLHFLMNNKLISALGLLATGVAIGVLVKYITLKRNPDVAKRVLAEESDERNQAIRDRAGSRGFEAAIGISALALIIYSAVNIQAVQPDPDPLWWLLAFLVFIPLSVYVYFLVRYQARM